MRVLAKGLLFACLGLFCQATMATPRALDCFGGAVKLDEEVWFDLGAQPNFSRALPGRNMRGVYNTKAQVSLEGDDAASGSWWDMGVRFHFPQGRDIASLPYNIYAIAVEIPSEGFSYFHDFTAGCTLMGPSIYPGQSVSAPATQLPRLPAGSPEQRMRVQVWGHL